MDKKKTFSSQAVKEFLNKTGFPFEWKMERVLREKKWEVVDISFLDLEEGKKREIDIVAAKTINDVDVCLIIECKYSERNSWIFFSPSDDISKPYSYFITSTSTYPDSLKKMITSHLRIFRSTEPTAINFIVYDNYTAKQANGLDIKDALYKVVKALIYCYSYSSDPSKRQIYFPLILFSGPIFSASYSNRLRVRKSDYIQFPFEFESDAYIEKKERPGNSYLTVHLGYDSYQEERKIREIEHIQKTYTYLYNEYLIEFVSGNKFNAYLDQLESEIGKIDINLWPVKSKKE